MTTPTDNPATPATPAEITLCELHRGDDMSAFRALNEEWISRYFTLEQRDRDQLNHPETLIDRGGHIYMAFHHGAGVGCVALVPMGNGVFELSKMAVCPELRGLGLGRLILQYAIQQARHLRASSLFLGSNTKLTSAVKLYESAGFQHLPAERIPQLGYTRANVFMELNLL